MAIQSWSNPVAKLKDDFRLAFSNKKLSFVRKALPSRKCLHKEKGL